MYHNTVTLSRGLLPLFYLMHELIRSIVRHKMALELAISTGLIAKRINVGAYFVVEREKKYGSPLYYGLPYFMVRVTGFEPAA